MENSTDYFFECCKGINSKLAYYFELKNKNDASLKKEMDNTLGHVHLFASEMSDTCRNLTFDDEKTQELYNRILEQASGIIVYMGYVSHGRNAINKELTDEDYFREASTLKVNLGILNGYLTRIQSLTEEILKDKTIGGK